jgi:DNA-binding beta-propeller fold protein YncE
MINLREKFAAADELTPPDLWGEAQRRAATQPSVASAAERLLNRPRQRLAAATIAIAIFAVAAIFAWNVLEPLKEKAIAPSPIPTTSVRPLAITETLKLRFGDFGVVAGANSVWIAAYRHVQRVDPTSMTVTASIRVQGLDDQDSIAIGSDVWVTDGSHHEVVAIDPVMARIVRRVRVPHIPVQVAADGQNVWVISATSGAGRIYRIDGATGVVTSRGQLSTSPRLPFTAGGGSAWVAEGSGLRRLGSDGSTATVDLSGGEVSALTFGDGSVWALASDGGISRVDPSSNHTIASFPSPSGIGLAEAAGRVWILTDTGSRSKTVYIPDPRDPSLVVSFDADTGQLVGQAVKVGFAPAWIAADGGFAWVAKFDSERLLRISTT